MTKNEKEYSDVSTVKSRKEHLMPKEYPEGPYGSPIRSDDPVEGKSTAWVEGQKRQSAFAYADRDLHEHTPRQTPGAHPVPKKKK